MTGRQCFSQNRVRTPHPAANPNSVMKATLMKRPETALLLQPWSTAITQSKNRTTAMKARIFSNINCSFQDPSTCEGSVALMVSSCAACCSDTDHGLAARGQGLGASLFVLFFGPC